MKMVFKYHAIFRKREYREIMLCFKTYDRFIVNKSQQLMNEIFV